MPKNKNFCVQRHIIDKIRKDFKDNPKTYQEFINMTTDQRREKLNTYFKNKELSAEVNLDFEKLIVENAKKEMSTFFDDILKVRNIEKDKINKLKELFNKKIQMLQNYNNENAPILTEVYQQIEDYIFDSLGFNLTSDNIKKMTELFNAIDNAKFYETKLENGKIEKINKVDSLGLPTTEYFKKMAELNNYILSQNPSNIFAVGLSQLSRAFMLLSASFAVLNEISNIIKMIPDIIDRRVQAGNIGIYKLQKYHFKYILKAVNIFIQTGFDITRSNSYDDYLVLGEKLIHSYGGNNMLGRGIRKFTRANELVAFRMLGGITDVMHAAIGFVDAANIAAINQAKSENLKGVAFDNRVKELFMDSLKIDKNTYEGRQIRKQAIASAQFATYTHDSQISKGALKIRDIINDWTGNIGVGEIIVPFAKIPANVVDVALKLGGGQLLTGSYQTIKGIKNNDNALIKLGLKNILSNTINAAIFIGIAIALLDPDDDYMPDYIFETKQINKQILEGAIPASINIKKIFGIEVNHWISLDYLGVYGALLAGTLMYKKTNGDLNKFSLEYFEILKDQYLRIPGIKEFNRTFQSSKARKKDDTLDLGKTLLNVADGTIDFLAARFTPAILGHLAQGIDDYQRYKVKDDTKETFQNKIPFWREDLPVKPNFRGEPTRIEGFFTHILFGSRVKKAYEDPILSELSRLNNLYELPQIIDIQKMGGRIKELRTQIGEKKFYEVIEFHNKKLFELLEDFILNNNDYKKYSDDQRRIYIKKLSNEAVKQTLINFKWERVLEPPK